MEKRAVLIGHNYNSILSIARALGENGYAIDVIRTGASNQKGLKTIGEFFDSKCRYIDRFMIASSKKPEEIIKILLGEYKSDAAKSVLFPIDDIAAELIDNSLDVLKDHYYLPNIRMTQGQIVKVMDKHFQKQLAREVGLLSPNGVSVELSHGTYTLPDSITFPCFARPETSFNGRKKYMKRCDNEQELKALLDKTAAFTDCSMLIEDLIEIEREYCIVGLCNKDKVCIPDMIEETVMGHDNHAGVTCYGRLLSPDNHLEFINKLKEFLARLDFQGLFTVDVMESKGKLYFCEINMRMGASGAAVLISGVNLALMFANIIRGDRSVDYDVVCRQLTFANEKPLINDYANRHISWKEYKDYLKKADIRFILSDKDMKPYHNYLLYELKLRIKRLVKR